MRTTNGVILSLAFALVALLGHVASMTCPSSCPLMETSEGTSRCCSMGDAEGCGLCDTSSCPGNNLAKCNDIPGAHCDVEGPGCSIQFGKADCTSSAPEKCWGLVRGDTCAAKGVVVICQGDSGNCYTSHEAQICGMYPYLPTTAPTKMPTKQPTKVPTPSPTTSKPTKVPTASPTTSIPTKVPTTRPSSATPSERPVAEITNAPSEAPTELVPLPTEPPAENCLEWILGYSSESCTLTCSRASRSCNYAQLQEIVTQTDFYAMVASATDLESNTVVGEAGTFCNQGVNNYNFSTTPAAFTYVLCAPGGDTEQTYCNYPTSRAGMTGDCDTQYVYPPAQRFCPCTLGDCLVPTCNEWVLGYSSESCTLTCSRASGECENAPLEDIITQEAFYAMVAEVNPVDNGCHTGGSAVAFCNKGINTYTFAQAPAAFSYRTHNVNGDSVDTYCNYPTSLAGFTADCDTKYVYPPAQRFCNCKTSCYVPSVAPSAEPTAEPSAQPTVVPTVAPSVDPTAAPSTEPSVVPTSIPTTTPSANPFAAPTVAPTATPTASPSAVPTVTPTVDPTVTPTANPSAVPSAAPSASPSAAPTETPSAVPTAAPTVTPSAVPSAAPSAHPTAEPTVTPTAAPSAIPTLSPSAAPSIVPSAQPSASPTQTPTAVPTSAPTLDPTAAPTFIPTAAPSAVPSCAPSANPTFSPTPAPSRTPTSAPTGCFKFVVGYSQKSCTETCNDPELGGGVCRNDIMQTINTREDFDAMVASSIMLGSPNNPPTSSAKFCTWGVNLWPFATQAAAFAYQQYVPTPTPHYEINNYCWYQPDNFPAYPPATCDTQFLGPPSQRFCSCAIANCVDNGAFPEPHYRRLEETEEQAPEFSSAAELPPLALAAPLAELPMESAPVVKTVTADAEVPAAGLELSSVLSKQLLELSGIDIDVHSWQVQAALALCVLVAAVLSATLMVQYCATPRAVAAPEVMAETAKSLRALRVRRKKEIRIEVTTH